jgi:uncharacterized protein (AIM24 family)
MAMTKEPLVSVKHKIAGELTQMVTCQLEPDQAVYANADKFRWKTTNVSIETRLSTPSSGDQGAKKGGLLGTALEVGKRALAGQSLAFQWFRPSGGSGLVAFAGEMPGQVRALELDGSTGWYAERGAFVFAEDSIAFDIAFSGLSTARRSQQGFVLQRFTGAGTLVVAGGGNLVEIDPSAYGGKVQVHGGAVAAFSDAVAFSVERVGALNAQTAMTAIFGGQGLYLVTLEGAGPVLLQSTLHRTMLAEQERGETERHGLAGNLLDQL